MCVIWLVSEPASAPFGLYYSRRRLRLPGPDTNIIPLRFSEARSTRQGGMFHISILLAPPLRGSGFWRHRTSKINTRADGHLVHGVGNPQNERRWYLWRREAPAISPIPTADRTREIRSNKRLCKQGGGRRCAPLFIATDCVKARRRSHPGERRSRGSQGCAASPWMGRSRAQGNHYPPPPPPPGS